MAMVNTMKRIYMILAMLLCIVIVNSAIPALAADPTTEVHVVKYAADGTTILDETTVNYTWMEANLPVLGDGSTHYYFQGPVFEDEWNEVHPGEPYNMWNPGEDVNVESRDYGAVKGTDVKDLCELVGGMSPGDEVKIKAPDGFNKWFAYENVYSPDPEQGKIGVCWYNGEESITGEPQGTGYPGAFPNYYTGMRLMFFADTSTNPWGYHCFGDWNMHEYLDEKYWHYYTTYPSTSGLSVKWVSDILIYSSETLPEGDASASLDATANVTVAMVGISLNRTEIDYGDVGPGMSSDNESVEITNTGTMDVNVTLEVNGTTATAQSFYEQSLHVDGNLYNLATIIAQIPTSNSEDVVTQLRVPSDWTEAGKQDATFVFWAEA